jgi:hypothetical protein
MNKKVNTLLFILGATLFNVIVAIVSFVVLLLLYINFLVPLLPEGNHSWGFTLIFLACIAISFLVYRGVMRILLDKIEIEKYFDPLFVRKHVKKPSSSE